MLLTVGGGIALFVLVRPAFGSGHFYSGTMVKRGLQASLEGFFKTGMPLVVRV